MTTLEKQLAIDEGLRLKPYRDTVGKLTIGYGRNLDDVGISEEEALNMMRNDIAVSRRELSQYSWFRNLDDKRKDAVINMHFNLGLPRLLTFRKMIAALERGDYKRAADEALDSRWAVQVGERAVRIARVLRGD
ncbi:putative lysozyme [Idiomarinaceae phage Phi1M2-2]|uniref:putative lysozyme n=1 Tax=Idiomarinaceae phage Phi1M2-2 TaxID=1527515 RepID=UPI0004F63FD4|nr:putative lysozyme [Idiomarinaceae phage Phi1M2-2]AIM40791.1 putative lysozyme [Idiomarinaceae phage Phi1M2-2]